jgi:hypothetical protein
MSVNVHVEPERAATQAVAELNDITGWPEGMKLVRTKGSGKRRGFAIQHGASVLVTADRMVELLPWLTHYMVAVDRIWGAGPSED